MPEGRRTTPFLIPLPSRLNNIQLFGIAKIGLPAIKGKALKWVSCVRKGVFLLHLVGFHSNLEGQLMTEKTIVFSCIFAFCILLIPACGGNGDDDYGCLNCSGNITWRSYGTYRFNNVGDDSTAWDLVNDCGWHVYGSHAGGYGDTLQVASCIIDCPEDVDNPLRSDTINDYCPAATFIEHLPFEGSGDASASTVDSNDPAISNITYGHSVWYFFQARRDGYVTVDTSGSSYDTIAAAFIGSCGYLDNISYDDDSGEGQASKMVFQVSAAESYYLMIGSYGTTSIAGNLLLSVRYRECLPSDEEGVVLVWAYNSFYGFRVRQGWTGTTSEGIGIGSALQEFLNTYPYFQSIGNSRYLYEANGVSVQATFDDEEGLEELLVGDYFRY